MKFNDIDYLYKIKWLIEFFTIPSNIKQYKKFKQIEKDLWRVTSIIDNNYYLEVNASLDEFVTHALYKRRENLNEKS